MSNLFISHSSRDNEAAKELKARLEAQGHRSLFLDLDPEKGIQAGASWERTLYTKLRACRAVIALCSHNYLSSHWCFAELALARMEGKAIFALQIEPWKTKGEDQTKMPSILTEGQYTDLRKAPDEAYERLWHAFKVHGIVPAEHREWGPQDPPYPGLRAFDEQDAPIFFGRETEVQEGVELLSRVRRQGHPRLVMVLGASGSGKSSLARAGIVPRIRRDPNEWQVVGPFRPGPQPDLKLAYALAKKFEEVGQPRSEEEILEQLELADAVTPGAVQPLGADREPAVERLLEALDAFEKELTPEDKPAAESLERLKAVVRGRQTEGAAAHRRRKESPGGSPLADLASQLLRGSEASLVLIVDQFEELLGHEDEAQDRPHPANRFLRMLREALDAEGSPLLVLGTMRSDFLEAFQKSPALLGAGFKKLSLGPMSREGMRQVIEEPAKLGHLELENGLTDLLLDETGTSDALPLLAFTLRVMWDRFTNESNRVLAIRDYRALGGLQGAMAQVADETLEAALEKGSEEDLRDAFLSLARPAAEGSGWTRQPVSWDDLASVHPMIQHFVDKRLLVTRQDGTVEVAHEALFRSWETLRGWLSENTEALHLRREIGIAAQKWKDAREEEKDQYLWRKGRLQRAIELRDQGRLSFGEDALEFLELCKEVEERARRRKRRRLQGLLAAATLAAAVMTVLAILAWLGQRRAQIQAAKALTIQARGAGYPLDQSLLIAVETSRTLERLKASVDLYEARTTLLGMLLTYPQLDSFLHGHEDQISTLAISPDGERLASGGADGRLMLWRDNRSEWNLDHCSGAPLPPDQPAGPCGDSVKQVVFSPGGERLASSGTKGKIFIWNASTGQLEAKLEAELEGEDPRPGIEGLAFISDDLVVAGDMKGRVRLWSIAEQRVRHELGFHPKQDAGQSVWISRIAVTSSGKVLSASADQTLRVWDVPPSSQGDGHGRVLCQSDQTIYGLTASSRGMVATGFANGVVRVWPEADLLAEREGTEKPPNCSAGGVAANKGEIRNLGFSPDGRILASAGFDGIVKLWAVEDAERLTELGGLEGHGRGAWAVGIGPDEMVTTGAGDGMLRVWDISRREPRFFRRPKKTGNGESLLLVAFGKDEIAATGDMGGEVRLVSLPDLRDGPAFVSKHGEVTGLAFDPNGVYLATAVDYTVYLWELATLRKAGPGVVPPFVFDNPDTHKSWIWGLAFSPDGRQLASFDNGGNVKLWTVPSGTVRHLLGPGSAVRSLVFDPRPGTLVLALGKNDGSIEFWDARDGAETPAAPLREFPSQNKRVAALAFSRDGLRLATGGADNTIKLWNTEREDEPVELKGHEAQVISLAFSPDGRRIASGDDDALIRVWDAETGLAQFGILDHGDEVRGLVFEEGGWLTSGSLDETFRRWEIGLIDPLASAYERACRLANRNLDRKEWAKFFGNEKHRKTCPNLPLPVS